MSERPSLLIVDDESAILDSLRILFKNEGFDVAVARGGPAALEAIEKAAPDIILTDVRMPTVNGIDVLIAAKQRDADLPVVLMTAQAELKTAIEGVNRGAFHYLQKPFDNDELVSICRRALEHRRLKTENRVLKQEIQRRDRSGIVKPIGVSKPFRDLMRMVETVAPTDSTVLVQGESGTGKEVIARYIHALSTRARGSFFSINCGALPEGILESELFGHVKGSFTGAVRDHEGLFAAAAGGSFFLDEIGETTPATQVKLLRVLQEREAIPVGGTQPVPVDVRLIAATNRDLEDDMKQGRFRSDLYYRLNVIALHLPPLRERRDDIPLLADAFLRRMASERSEAPKSLERETLEAMLALRLAGQRARAGERAGAGLDPDQGRRDRRVGAPGPRHRAARAVAAGRAPVRQPDAGRRRAGVHPVGAAVRGREQDPRGGGAGHRPVHAVPEAGAIRRGAVTAGR